MKRLIMAASDKGGVGKSFTTIQIVQWLKDQEREFRAFDPDHTNSTLLRFHPDAIFVDISKPQSMDQIALAFEEVPLVIVDGIGGQKGVFLKWINSVALFDIAKAMDMAMTFVLIVDEDKDTVAQTKETLLTVGDAVDWLVVKNHKTVGHTDMWDGSEGRQIAHELGAREITLPKLTEHLISEIQRNNLPIAEAVRTGILNMLDRSRCNIFISDFNEALSANSDILLDTEIDEPVGGEA